MKVLMLNGSPHAKGCTYTALHEMEKIFRQEGISCELIQVGQEAVRGCIACGQCRKLGRCVFTTDSVNLVLEKWENADCSMPQRLTNGTSWELPSSAAGAAARAPRSIS